MPAGSKPLVQNDRAMQEKILVKSGRSSTFHSKINEDIKVMDLKKNFSTLMNMKRLEARPKGRRENDLLSVVVVVQRVSRYADKKASIFVVLAKTGRQRH